MADATNRIRFYQGDRLQAVQSGKRHVIFIREAQRPLLQREQDAAHSDLLICDAQNSVLQIAGAVGEPMGYLPYGYTPRLPSPDGGLAFNGEFVDPSMKSYLLGSYRLYNPVLMRFYAPDSESPFQGGGVNTYGYCVGDPVNASDPTGHWPLGGINFMKRHSSTALKGVPSHGIPGKYSRLEPNTALLKQVPAPKLPAGGLPEVVRNSIHVTQYNMIRERQFKQAHALFKAFDAGEIDKDQLKRNVGSMLRVNESIEMKKEESIKRGYFFSTLPHKTAESGTSSIVGNIRGVHN